MTQYHHGNLKTALIETGIKYVNENGMSALSLRKLATLCGVTHTAIYSHFKDKETLIKEMQLYVSEQFASSMQDGIDQLPTSDPQQIMFAIAAAYVTFFLDNPNYFYFLFKQVDFKIDFDHLEVVNDYRPFEIFKSNALNFLKARKVPPDYHTRIVIGLWGTVHGITSIAVMSGTTYSGDWVKTTLEIFAQNFELN